MRTLKLIEYVTLDGVVEDPGPSGGFKYRGWTIPYWNEEMAEAQSKELFASDALLLGRVTYEDFVAAWPLRSGDAFTDKINSMKKFVATHNRERSLTWNAELLGDDVIEAVENLKKKSGSDILIYGSPTLVRALMPHRLIDEYHLIVYPLILGQGKRLFQDGIEKLELKLLSTKRTTKGVTLLTYTND